MAFLPVLALILVVAGVPVWLRRRRDLASRRRRPPEGWIPP